MEISLFTFCISIVLDFFKEHIGFLLFFINQSWGKPFFFLTLAFQLHLLNKLKYINVENITRKICDKNNYAKLDKNIIR